MPGDRDLEEHERDKPASLDTTEPRGEPQEDHDA
jgi:hypothetical protein